jgi:hypothetical protein
MKEITLSVGHLVRIWGSGYKKQKDERDEKDEKDKSSKTLTPDPNKRQDKGFRPAGSLFNSRGAKPTVTTRTQPNPDKSIIQCQRKGHGVSYPGAYAPDP